LAALLALRASLALLVVTAGLVMLGIHCWYSEKFGPPPHATGFIGPASARSTEVTVDRGNVHTSLRTSPL